MTGIREVIHDLVADVRAVETDAEREERHAATLRVMRDAIMQRNADILLAYRALDLCRFGVSQDADNNHGNVDRIAIRLVCDDTMAAIVSRNPWVKP